MLNCSKAALSASLAVTSGSRPLNRYYMVNMLSKDNKEVLFICIFFLLRGLRFGTVGNVWIPLKHSEDLLLQPRSGNILILKNQNSVDYEKLKHDTYFCIFWESNLNLVFAQHASFFRYHYYKKAVQERHEENGFSQEFLLFTAAAVVFSDSFIFLSLKEKLIIANLIEFFPERS